MSIMRLLPFISMPYDLLELDHYLSVTEEYLIRAKADFEERTQEDLKKMLPEEQGEFSEDLAELSWRYSEVFPRLLRRSFLVTAVSVFEYNVRQICKQFEGDKILPVGLSDLNGDLFERLRKFLKLAQIPVSFTSPTWRELTNISRVRNCIVHNDGFFKGSSQERQLRTYAKRNNIVSMDTIEEEISPTKEFSEKVIRTMEAFMHELHSAYQSTRSR